MAPPSVDIVVQEPTDKVEHLKNGNSTETRSNGDATKTLIRAPLNYSGALDEYEAFDVTSVIGREYPNAQLSEILTNDAKIRDLAITGELFWDSNNNGGSLLTFPSFSTWCRILSKPDT